MNTVKSYRWSALGLGLALAFTATSEAAWVNGRVEKIVDGDTIWLRSNDGERMKIRLLNSDTPELNLNGQQQPLAQAATDALAKLIPVRSEIRVDVNGIDNYKRPLGFVFQGKKDINLEMVRSGWAAMYVYCTGKTCTNNFFERQRVAEYVDACKTAMAQKEGIFNSKKPLRELPFEFRLRVQHRRPDKHVGNFTTKEYVEPNQYAKVPVCDRIFFGNADEAKRAGFKRAN